MTEHQMTVMWADRLDTNERCEYCQLKEKESYIQYQLVVVGGYLRGRSLMSLCTDCKERVVKYHD